ncbi:MULTISPECIES: biotin-dependent carboxyltransferase family protein [unclassified Mesorhizobium]|uniref:5-oxoprolinase subunit C family protein n=1 Tax=unclassified Mesorhizobium TaxID=325217 RepID=UPI002415C50C|nr:MULTISPECIES: biotin-dependent carboxyltransferase family protein [unclassified Mesorhizobium]WFP65573.1 biotin-dependent carboxyltransferase family protein [Mesorhizobium sp. WSM4904]WFP78838.1 biotin-dependent carboxyltransferase family protein [Mesorhizobium sp. WSM4906]
MDIEVIKPGLLTTIQDLGRPGYYHLGIPISGAMDRHALRAANLLVGNDEGDAALEAVFTGPELTFTDHRIIAVTGADLPPKVDGESRPTWAAFEVEPGQTLSFGFLKRGARAYIAISGGFEVPLLLGSRSTYVHGQFGGLDGRPLKSGDRLPAGARKRQSGSRLRVADEMRRTMPADVVLRVLPGLYNHRLTPVAEQRFYDDTWAVAPDADRVGYRFRGGSPLEFKAREQPFGAGADPSNIVDACYPYGSIQVPAGTEPIVLHRDAVSGGGYFTLGTVIAADMDLIGQLQPHQKIRFAPVDMPTALAARRHEADRLDRLRRGYG